MIDDSDARLLKLNSALSQPDSPSYADARTAITIEEKVKKDLDGEKKALAIEPLRDALPGLIIVLLVSVLLALAATRLAAWQGLAALGGWSPEYTSENWQKPYWAWAIIIFCAHAAREIFTSIVQTTNKSWFAWSSFCVSNGAWVLMLAIAFGFAMVVAYPLTVLWHFGRNDLRPTLLDLNHTDGRWGVGSYVLFLQTWTLLSLVFLVFPVALWLRTVRNDPRMSPAYLLTSGVLFAAGLLISARLIRNAIAIRRTYETKLRELGSTWREIQDKKPPADPTISFLGEHWLKLPTVILGMFAFLWLILEQFGVSNFLLELTGMK